MTISTSFERNHRDLRPALLRIYEELRAVASGVKDDREFLPARITSEIEQHLVLIEYWARHLELASGKAVLATDGADGREG